MRFLVDAQLPPALCRWLEQRSHEAAHVSDFGMVAADDRAVATLATRESMILISKDEDFAAAYLRQTISVVWLRCGNTTNRALAAWLEPRWPEIEKLLNNGERLVEVR